MVAPLSEVPQEGSSVFSLFSLIKPHLASHPLASSYSHVAVPSVFCAQYTHISAQTRGAPLSSVMGSLLSGQGQLRKRLFYGSMVASSMVVPVVVVFP